MAQSFRKAFYAALGKAGFERSGAVVALDRTEARILISVETRALTSHIHISFGIWIKELSKAHWPDRHNLCHIYGALDAILPELVEPMRGLGPDSKPEQVRVLSLAQEIYARASELLSLDGLRTAYSSGRFERCLIRAEARAALSS
jgi:hypothetical protein